MRNSRLLYLLFSVLVMTGCFSQHSPDKYSLLTWEYKREGDGTVPIENAYVLVKYIFSDTSFSRKELFRTDYYIPHYADYPAKIYDNRYLINSRGDIFDLLSNKMIHDHIGFDYFVGKDGESVYFKHVSYQPNPPFHNDTARHNSIKTPFYFFDLATGKINQVNSGETYVTREPEINVLPGMLPVPGGILSPDKKMMAYFVPSDTILNYDFSKRDTSLMLCGWTRMFPTYGSIFLKSPNGDSARLLQSVLFYFGLWVPNSLPIKWLNNNEILTQKKRGALVKINIKTYVSESYPVLNDVFPCSYPPRLEETENGDMIYYCPSKNGFLFKVDTRSGSIDSVSTVRINENYSVQPRSGHPDDEYIKGYFYKNNKITDDTTTTLHYSITPNDLIAIQCKEMIPSRNQYDHWNTIKIFDPAKKEWTHIKIEYLKELVGWVKEK